MAKRIIILGATGSIGLSTVDVVRSNREEFQIVAMAALRSREACEALAREFGAKAYVGADAALQAVEENEADICLVATVGQSGVKPTFAAIDKGMDIALATKEVMVMHGEEVSRRAKAKGVRFLPVDSEHSAIFQCLQPYNESIHRQIDKLILTCSGGPFLDEPRNLELVTKAQALNHPRWKMGPKVTIDSATMMNKGFELIEARWLFDIPPERIEIVIHPESIVHSLVTFRDGSTLAQLAEPDMRVPIQYALSWPERWPAERKALDLAQLGALTFRKPDEERFPCLKLAKRAIAEGGDVPARLALADEEAVDKFLRDELKFAEIPAFLEEKVWA